MSKFVILAGFVSVVLAAAPTLQISLERPVGGAIVSLTILRSGVAVETGLVSESPATSREKLLFDSLDSRRQQWAVGRVRPLSLDVLPDTPMLVTATGGLEWSPGPATQTSANSPVVSGEWQAIVSKSQLLTGNVVLGPELDVIYGLVESSLADISDTELWSRLDNLTTQLLGDDQKSYPDLLEGEVGLIDPLLREALGKYTDLIRQGFTLAQRQTLMRDELLALMQAPGETGNAEDDLESEDRLRAFYDNSIESVVINVCASCHQFATPARLLSLRPDTPEDNYRLLATEPIARQLVDFCDGGHQGGALFPAELDRTQCDLINEFGRLILSSS